MSTRAPGDDLLTTTQVARELGLSRVRVFRLVSGQSPPLAARKVGRDWLVSRGDLEAFRVRERPRGRPRKVAGEERGHA